MLYSETLLVSDCVAWPLLERQVTQFPICQIFGQKEVFGFLGAWVEAAADPQFVDDSERHYAYRPTLADVRRYLERHGLSP